MISLERGDVLILGFALLLEGLDLHGLSVGEVLHARDLRRRSLGYLADALSFDEAGEAIGAAADTDGCEDPEEDRDTHIRRGH